MTSRLNYLITIKDMELLFLFNNNDLYFRAVHGEVLFVLGGNYNLHQKVDRRGSQTTRKVSFDFPSKEIIFYSRSYKFE